MYGVFKSKEEYDLWMAEWRGAMASLHESHARADEIMDRLTAEKAGDIMSLVGDAIVNDDSKEALAKIGTIIEGVERAADLAMLIPVPELKEHADVVKATAKGASVLAAFLRGFMQGLK